jgi:glycerol-3-phosphate O-acyltransferase/dihydroxyacetone phosphate acyltransferase
LGPVDRRIVVVIIAPCAGMTQIRFDGYFSQPLTAALERSAGGTPAMGSICGRRPPASTTLVELAASGGGRPLSQTSDNTARAPAEASAPPERAEASGDEAAPVKALGAAYHLLVSFLRIVTQVFFRTIEVVGTEHIPEEGPVIFTGNHPNSLIDPVLITTTCGRDVRFAAKDVLFESRGLRFFLNTLGAVPIRRRMDHKGEAKLDNAAAFDALFAVLRSGNAFGIFPEGISHARSELAPLKTGAARIALGASSPEQPITIVPCGLTYKRRTRLRSRVLIQYGQPIVVGGDDGFRVQGEGEEAEKDAAKALTDAIGLGLRALTINAPDFDTLKVLDGVRRLYSPQHKRLTLAERAEITRRLIDHYERYADNPKVHTLYGEVSAYLFKLSALGLRDRDLTKPLKAKVWITKLIAHLILLFVLAPLALPGVIIHAPILIAAVIAGDALTQRKDVIATTKLMVATGLVLLCYAGIVAALVYLMTFPIGLYIAPAVIFALLLSGWAMIRVLERQSVIRRGASVLVLIIDLKQQLVMLREIRSELRQRTLDLIDELIDPELERVIAPEEQT